MTDEIDKSSRLRSDLFSDLEAGTHYIDYLGQEDVECVKTGSESAMPVEPADIPERQQTANGCVTYDGQSLDYSDVSHYKVRTPSRCHRALKVGDRVRVTRTISKKIDSSISQRVGEETFTGVIQKENDGTAWVVGDKGQRQVISSRAGDEHGHPVVSVEMA